MGIRKRVVDWTASLLGVGGPGQVLDKAIAKTSAAAGQSMIGSPTPDETADNAPKPTAGERTSAQVPMGNALGMGVPGIPEILYQQAGGNLFQGGLLGLNSMWGQAFPGLSFNFCGAWAGIGQGGWIMPRRGTYGTYRIMDQDPTLSLIYALITKPILASQWTVAAAKGVGVTEDTKPVEKDGRITEIPRQWIEFISDQVLPLRQPVLPFCMRYLSFGVRCFERVYEVRPGPMGRKCLWLTKLKPLAPELTQIMWDGQGNYTGLSAGGTDLSARESWIVTHGGEDMYGWSRHEQSFDPWTDGNYVRLRRALTAAKIANWMVIMWYRPGTTLLGGKPTDNAQIAKQILATMQCGNGVCCPTTEYEDSELQQNPELAKLAPWKIEVVDCGNYAPAIDGLLKEADYSDVQKGRGWGWPERAWKQATEGGLGSGDAGVHLDAATADREAVDDDIAQQLSSGQPLFGVPGVIDEMVALNLDERAKGLIVLKPGPLVDSKTQLYEKLFEAALANPGTSPQAFAMVEWPEVLDQLDIATPDDLKAKMPQLIQAVADAAKAKTDAQAKTRQQAVEKATGKNNRITVPGDEPGSNGDGAVNN